ncbi:MAG: helicase-related protein, partial [Polyangiaceae bacterium]
VQSAFNSAPEKDPVRILIATDAAREGVNLQAHCADLFHLDIPWNPSRLEQRNGRIDRTLQPADEVRCHYFVYPQRTADPILDTVVRKTETVQNELGSLGAVLLEQIARTLKPGITDKTRSSVDAIGVDAKSATVDVELEASRNLAIVRAEIEKAGQRLESSRRALEVDADSLRGVVDIGLALTGLEPLSPLGETQDRRPTYSLPSFENRDAWASTIDTLRPPRERDEDFWKWRRRPPRPVTFHPLTTLSEEAEQLHLAHPFVRRILDRFLAQGFGAHDLSRVTAILAPDESVIRVIAYGRLTLFGIGAARLHDALVPIAAAWSGEAASITPYKDPTTARTTITKTEHLLAAGAKIPNARICSRIVENSAALFRALWPHLEAEADATGAAARRGLAERARRESTDLRAILSRQRVAIDNAETRLRQSDLFQVKDKDQKRQVDADLRHLNRRREQAAGELESEPAAIEALYEVRMSRLTPIGLVVAWPELMT